MDLSQKRVDSWALNICEFKYDLRTSGEVLHHLKSYMFWWQNKHLNFEDLTAQSPSNELEVLLYNISFHLLTLWPLRSTRSWCDRRALSAGKNENIPGTVHCTQNFAILRLGIDSAPSKTLRLTLLSFPAMPLGSILHRVVRSAPVKPRFIGFPVTLVHSCMYKSVWMNPAI